MIWARQTYSLLDWLGDLGGLLDIMFYIGRAFVSPVANYTLYTTMMASFFRYKTGESYNTDGTKKQNQVGQKRDKSNETLFDKIKNEFLASEKIPKLGYFMTNCFCCFNWRESRKYHQIINKSRSRLAKEMDMQKFLHR